MEEVISENVEFRYCTEAILKNTTIAQHDLMDLLGTFGDSAVVAGSDKMRRLHVHTNNPADLFYSLRKPWYHCLSES